MSWCRASRDRSDRREEEEEEEEILWSFTKSKFIYLD